MIVDLAGSVVRVKRTKDYDDIKYILNHPKIYPLISDPDCPPMGEFEPPHNVDYIGGYYMGWMFGVSCVHRWRDGWKFHPNVLPEFRAGYARQFIHESLMQIQKPVYVEIPNDRKALYNLCVKTGFQEIERNTDKTVMRLL